MPKGYCNGCGHTINSDEHVIACYGIGEAICDGKWLHSCYIEWPVSQWAWCAKCKARKA